MHAATFVLPPRPPRRLILGTAFLLALVVSLPPKSPDANAQDAKAPPAASTTTAAPEPTTAPTPPKTGVESGRPGVSINIGDVLGSPKASPDKADDDEDLVDHDLPGTITIKKNGKTVRVTGLPPDREFDSVEQFITKEPRIATMVISVVALVFMAPVLAIALIVWYRIRKARMLNETMLKLAEKGVVAPADALDAIAAGSMIPSRAGTTAGAGAGLALLNAQARDVRKRVAWSDLRKGTVMAAIGLAISFSSYFEDRTPNVVGLVLLFVGIGYIALWWFEERQLAPTGTAQGAPLGARGPGDSGPGSTG